MRFVALRKLYHMVCLDQELLMEPDLPIFTFAPWALAFGILVNLALSKVLDLNTPCDRGS